MKRNTPPTKALTKRNSKKRKTQVYEKYATPSLKGPSLKCFQISLNNQNYFASGGSAGAVALCLGIAQGDAEYNRDGTHVRHKSLTFRGEIYIAPAASGYVDSDVLRTCIIYDRSPNGVLPIFSDIVYNSGTGTSAPIDPFSFKNRDRFYVVRDWLHSTNDFTATVAASIPTYTSKGVLDNSTPLILKAFKNFNFKLDTKFLSSSGAISGIQAGAFYVVTQGTFASPGPYFLNWSMEFVYSDSLH